MKYITSTLILLTVLSFPLLVNAQGTDGMEKRGEMMERKEERMQEREDMMHTKRCENFDKKIANRIRHFITLQGAATKRFDNLVTRLENLSAKAQEQGIDTTTLDSQIANLASMVADLKASYDDIVAQLQELGQQECTDETGSYQELFAGLRESVAELHGQAAEIRSYFDNEIKPTLHDIRAQFEELAGEEE